MSSQVFKAVSRLDGRWTVIVVETQASALPAYFEPQGLEATDAAMLAAVLNMFVKSDGHVGNGETWKPTVV